MNGTTNMRSTGQEGKTALFFGGMVIGALVAALLSPKSGEEMRGELKEKARHVKEKIESKKDEVADKANEAADKADQKVNETQSRLQRARDKGNTTP
jgi:gas vesicle protein